MRRPCTLLPLLGAWLLLPSGYRVWAQIRDPAWYSTMATWQQTMLAARDALAKTGRELKHGMGVYTNSVSRARSEIALTAGCVSRRSTEIA